MITSTPYLTAKQQILYELLLAKKIACSQLIVNVADISFLPLVHNRLWVFVQGLCDAVQYAHVIWDIK